MSADTGSSPGRGAGTGTGQLRVTQVRSSISTKPKHRGTLRALGLRGVGRTRILPDRPEIRGMIARVPHLVTVEPASEQEAVAERGRLEAARAEHRAAERSGTADAVETAENPGKGAS
ncbi:MAG: 50S ribosomal protein L30 [Acidimicrobiales bacterium]